MNNSLSYFISHSTTIIFLMENSKSSLILGFLINLLLIFRLLYLSVYFLYIKHLSVRLLNLVALPSSLSVMTLCLALCSTYKEHELWPRMLDISLTLAEFSWCWSLLTIIGSHLVISFQFFVSLPVSLRSISNLSSKSGIFPARLIRFFSFLYYFYVTVQ